MTRISPDSIDPAAEFHNLVGQLIAEASAANADPETLRESLEEHAADLSGDSDPVDTEADQ